MVYWLSVLLVLFSSVLGAFGQLQFKKGMSIFSYSTFFSNYPLLSGLFLYGISTVIYLSALRGEELSVLYPIVATSYVWAAFLAVYFLGEQMNTTNWVGIFMILLGVFFVVH